MQILSKTDPLPGYTLAQSSASIGSGHHQARFSRGFIHVDSLTLPTTSYEMDSFRQSSVLIVVVAVVRSSRGSAMQCK
jgi:hypothetical protein